MRALSFLCVLGVFALGACDSAQEVTAPEVPEPQFHWFDWGTPDGDYSMYYVDLDLQHNLLLKLAQEFTPGSYETMCPGNVRPPADPFTTHNTDGDEPDFPAGWAMPGAHGFGSFMKKEGWRRTRGSLFVTGACWFDEWNPDGFPESAWVTGWAFVNWRFQPFKLMLQSRGFPAQGHILMLDRGVLEVSGGPALDLLGEIHHEDGLTLIQ